MKPIIIEVFGLAIHSYGLMLAFAFLIGIVGLSRLVKSEGISFDTVVDLGIWILIGAVVGARLAYIATEYKYYILYPLEIFKINSGGLAFHGGLIGGFGAGIWFCKLKQIHPWKLADLVTPFIALGYAIVRIGCLLNGCCYGKPTTLWLGLHCAVNDLTLRHPTQLYSMIGSFILFGVLLSLRKHHQFPGFLFALYVGLYSLMRFIVEFFREGPLVFPWLSLAQLVCVVLGLGAYLIIVIQQHRYQKGRYELDATAEVHRGSSS